MPLSSLAKCRDNDMRFAFFLNVQERSHLKHLKKASKMSECFLMRALFEWPNHYEALPLITFQILITLKLLLNLRANLITNMNSLISTIPSPHTERQTKKATTWYKTVAELPNAMKLLQRYRMERKHWGVAPLHPR